MFNKKLIKNISRVIIILFVITSSVCFARGGHGGGHGGGHSSCRSVSTSSSRSLVSSRSSKSVDSKRSNLSIHTSNIKHTHQLEVIFTSIIYLLFLIPFANNKFTQYKKNIINISREKYINEFLIKFSNINNIPKWNDIEFFYKNLEEQVIIDEVLIPLIIHKINNINEMCLYEQYNFYYTQNTDQIDLFQLDENTISINEIRYKIQESNEINNLLMNNKYLDLRVTVLIDQTDENYNIDYMNIKHIAVIYFNRKEILKNIILQVFLNEDEDNDIEFIKNDILKQIKDYHDNKVIYLNNNKIPLLITAIKENINENLEFKEKFVDIFNKTFITYNNH